MIDDTYVRTRVTEVQHEFATARRWRRLLKRLADRARGRDTASSARPGTCRRGVGTSPDG